MKFTNKHNLPKPVANALAHSAYQKHGDFSCTQLINAPRASILCERHKDEIETDVIDMLWAVRGTGIHHALSQNPIEGSIVEERFLLHVGSHTVSMQPDYVYPLEPNKYRLLDFKDTSRFAIKDGLKPEWDKQLNLYAYGFYDRGITITRADIVVILKDWSYTECHVKHVANYPDAPIQVVNVPLWTPERARSFLMDRIELFVNASNLKDDELPECTMHERWAKPDRFAAVFTSGKSKGNAAKGGANFDSKQEAESFIKERSAKAVPCKVEYRQGESTKCERYCLAKKFCNQYKSKIKRMPF